MNTHVSYSFRSRTIALQSRLWDATRVVFQCQLLKACRNSLIISMALRRVPPCQNRDVGKTHYRFPVLTSTVVLMIKNCRNTQESIEKNNKAKVRQRSRRRCSSLLTGVSRVSSSTLCVLLYSRSVRKFRHKSVTTVRCAADFSGDYPIKLDNYISMIDFANSPTPRGTSTTDSRSAGFAMFPFSCLDGRFILVSARFRWPASGNKYDRRKLVLAAKFRL